MNNAHAFVAGATGLTGRHVVTQLAQRGVQVTAHVRSGSSAGARLEPEFIAAGAKVHRSGWEVSAITEALTAAQPTIVFSLLGTTKKRARAAAKEGREENYETIDFGLSKRLYDAAASCKTSPRFVYLSSMGVSAKTSNPYLKARAKMEAVLERGVLPFVIARPSFITGGRDERRVGEEIGARAADVLLSGIGALGGSKLRDRYRSTSGPRLARALVTLALSDETGTFESGALYQRGQP